MAALLFIVQYWHWAAVILLSGTVILQHNNNRSLKHEVQATAFQLEISRGSVKGLQTAIKQQNAAVDKLKKDSDAHVAKAQKEVVAATVAREKSDKTAKEIMDSRKPKGAEACTAADKLINGELK